MSYDLMVFDPEAAPRDRQAFRAWFSQQAEWGEDHDYGDPVVTTPRLCNWYEAIRRDYPNMNGPDAAADDDIDRSADYSIGKLMIYAAFPWSLAEDVYPRARELAVECEVGFYDVSGDEGEGEIYFPGDTLLPPSQGAWRAIAADFRRFRDEAGQ
jgi:hypothetical protein